MGVNFRSLLSALEVYLTYDTIIILVSNNYNNNNGNLNMMSLKYLTNYDTIKLMC